MKCKVDPKQLVLILVLLEYTLGDGWEYYKILISHGLNPCFVGIYSRSSPGLKINGCPSSVLILVLLEYTLGVKARNLGIEMN